MVQPFDPMSAMYCSKSVGTPYSDRFSMATFKRIAASCITVSVLAVAPCQAAFLDNVQGKIMVDQGDGFKLVNGPVTVKPGDRVMAQGDGSANVKYSGSCLNLVQPGAVVTVVPDGQCVNAQTSYVTTQAVQSIEAGAPAAGTEAGAAAAGAPAAGIGALGVGAVVVGAGGLVYLATKKSTGSSP